VFAAVLSGKELFNYNSSLFVDDEGAIDAAEEQTFNAESAAQAEAEEAQARADAERAQAEQLRLAEVQRLEDEANAHKDEQRRQLARAANRIMFELAGVRINQIVFDVMDMEDRELFPEYIETLVEVEHNNEFDRSMGGVTAAVGDIDIGSSAAVEVN
jgi:multidrug efflux pump subunit AcrA (membrane-fusion protein)